MRGWLTVAACSAVTALVVGAVALGLYGSGQYREALPAALVACILVVNTAGCLDLSLRRSR